MIKHALLTIALLISVLGLTQATTALYEEGVPPVELEEGEARITTHDPFNKGLEQAANKTMTHVPEPARERSPFLPAIIGDEEFNLKNFWQHVRNVFVKQNKNGAE